MQQIFNYHTHTKRCNHASIYETKEYVCLALQNGIKVLGFSDHVPFSELEYQEVNARMHISEADEYISEINALKKEFPDITLLTGFEVEYDEVKALFLCELRSKCDYLVLGQHYIRNISSKNNPNYPLEYAKKCIEAMESGLFDIFVHPDYFMIERRNITDSYELELFDKNSIAAARMISEKAKELSIPLEINLNGFISNKLYPNKAFWKVVEEVSPLVLIGSDAHSPYRFNEMKDEIDEVLNYFGDLKLNYVSENYNPVTNRNPILNSRLNYLVSKSYTYETLRAKEIMYEILTKLPNDLDKETISYQIESILKNNTNNLSIKATEMDKDLLNKMEKVALRQDISYEEKSFKLNRYKSAISHYNQTLLNQQKAYTRLIETVKTCFEFGVSNKNDLLDLIVKLTEIKTTKDLSVRNVLINEVNAFKNKALDGGQSNSAKLVKRNPMFEVEENHFFTWNTKGYVKAAILTLLLTFILGVFTGMIILMLH